MAVGVRCDMLCWCAISSGSYGELHHGVLCIGELGCVEAVELSCVILGRGAISYV
jgi:hypothetical protein